MIENESKNNAELTDIHIPEKIAKVFENQRMAFNKDILYLKEDILKDFKKIETTLNLKYEKLNSNAVAKLYKFENNIEAMKIKIGDLSSLISTDRNIQQKVLQLSESQRKTTDKITNQDIATKVVSKELKEAINKYDKILADSVIYPAILGIGAQFKNFHEMIDYILLSITQLKSFRDKNDIKEFSTKIENLYRVLKGQSDSIIDSCNTTCSKKVNDLENKFKKTIEMKNSEILELRIENKRILNEFKELTNLVKNKSNEELYEKMMEEIKILGEYKEEIEKGLEKYENEFNKINNRIKALYKKMKAEKEIQNKENTNLIQTGINLKKNQLGISIVKKYIEGEINFNGLDNSQSKKKKTISANKDNESEDKKKITIGSDKLEDMLNDNFIKKNSDINIYNDYEKKDKKGKESDYLTESSFFKSEENRGKSNKNANKKEIKFPNALSDEGDKSNDIYSTKQKAYKLLYFRESSSNKNKKDKIEKINLINNNKLENHNNIKKNYINNERRPIFTKLKKIGDNKDIINYNTKNSYKKNENKREEFYEKINNINNNKNSSRYNSYSIFNNFDDIKIKNTNNQLNVIEVNFDNKLDKNKEKDELQELIQKVKERRYYTTKRRNRNKENNRKIIVSKSDAMINNFDISNQKKLIVNNNKKKNYKSYEYPNDVSSKNSFSKIKYNLK